MYMYTRRDVIKIRRNKSAETVETYRNVTRFDFS